MHTPQQLRPRLTLVRRVLFGTGLALLLFTALLANPYKTDSDQAWAAALADCPTDDTIPNNLSIPIGPSHLFLKYGGPPVTYSVSLCKDPAAPVVVSATANISGLVTITPISLTFTNSVTHTIAVSVADGHPMDVPFTVVISHSASSADPEFNWGWVNVPTVTVYYSPPVAVDDFAAAPHGQSISITVLANDIDRRGAGLTLPPDAIVTNPTNGTASVNPDQTLQYTPTAGFFGLDTFTYRVEDATGNTDIGTVTVDVARPGTTRPQIKPGSPVAETVLEFLSSVGILKVTVPPLNGVPADADVVFTFADVITPTGDVDQPPVPIASFSGISFRFDGYINGEPMEPAHLTEPITLQIQLPDELVARFRGARIFVYVWDGTKWTNEGITAPQTISPTSENEVPFAFSTTTFGEFVLFIQYGDFIPYLEAN